MGYPEFEAGLELLMNSPSLRRRLGEAGRSYVEQNLRWDGILDEYDRFLEAVCAAAPRRTALDGQHQ
jgi:glycosyltransferase involved in cell wall biosynthesis